MQKSLPYSFALLLLISNASFAQKKYDPQNDKKSYSIPFVLTEYNNLSIQAIINEKDTIALMFHTAESSVNVTEGSTNKLRSLHFDDTTDNIRSWGGASNSSRLSNKNRVQIAGLKWLDVPIWEDENSGQHTDGKFGADLFENKVIEIDFDKKLITIYKHLPKKAKEYEKLSLRFKNDNMFVKLECKIGDSILGNEFLIHSGYFGDLLFDDQFVKDNHISEKLKVIGEKNLKDSYGHILKTKKAILPSLKIANEMLSNVPVGFFDGAIGKQKMSIIGADLLKRFNILIDASRTFIYLKPNTLEKSSYSNI